MTRNIVVVGCRSSAQNMLKVKFEFPHEKQCRQRSMESFNAGLSYLSCFGAQSFCSERIADDVNGSPFVTQNRFAVRMWHSTALELCFCVWMCQSTVGRMKIPHKKVKRKTGIYSVSWSNVLLTIQRDSTFLFLSLLLWSHQWTNLNTHTAAADQTNHKLPFTMNRVTKYNNENRVNANIDGKKQRKQQNCGCFGQTVFVRCSCWWIHFEFNKFKLNSNAFTATNWNTQARERKGRRERERTRS